ncbi:unnamed protein product, partial [Effrenium voratum]
PSAWRVYEQIRPSWVSLPVMSFSDVGTEWYSRPKSIINGRADLIKQRRQETDDPFADDETPPWLRCALSHTSLEGPSAQVVCDAKGHLMLKEDLLVALLNKRVPPHLGLRSLREVFQCNLRRSKDGSILCPVTGDELRCCKSAQVLRPCAVAQRKAVGNFSSCG